MFKRLFPNLRFVQGTIAQTTFSNDIKEQQITITGQTINFIKTGNGKHPLLLFPGALGTIWYSFAPQIKGLDKSKFTIIAWDPPGYGKSRPPNKNFHKNFYEDDADKAYEFMNAIGVKRYSILGWSDGGISSLILSAKHPESIRKLVIWGSNSYILKEEIEFYEKLKDTTKWPDKLRNPLLETYGDDLQNLWDQWNKVAEIIYKEGGNICKDKVKLIKCPTLIIHGDKDLLLSREHPQYLVNNIKGAKLYRFPKGRHDLHLRYAQEFNKVVTKFFKDPSKM